MNKEEILAKSRKENSYGDEREKNIYIKRDAFALWGFTILGLVIMALKLMHSQSPADIISMFFCTSGLGFAYQGFQLKNKWGIIAGIVLLLLSAYFFYQFYMGLL